MIYHITTPDRLPAIRRDGITPRAVGERFCGSDGRVCLSDRAHLTQWWAEMRDEYGLGAEGYAAERVMEWVVLPVAISPAECEEMGLGEYRLSRTIRPDEIIWDATQTYIRCADERCTEYRPHRHCTECGDLLWPSEPDCCAA